MKAVLLFVLAVLAHPGLARSGAAPALLQPLSLTLLQPHSLVFNATVGLARRLGETTNSRYYGEMLPGAHSEGVELLQEWLGELIESSIQGNATVLPNSYPAGSLQKEALRPFEYMMDGSLVDHVNRTVLRNPTFCRYLGDLWQNCGYTQTVASTDRGTKFVANCIFRGIDPSLAGIEAAVLNAEGSVQCTDLERAVDGHLAALQQRDSPAKQRLLSRAAIRLRRILEGPVVIMGLTWFLEQLWLVLEQAQVVDPAASTASDINLVGALLAIFALLINVLTK